MLLHLSLPHRNLFPPPPPWMPRFLHVFEKLRTLECIWIGGALLLEFISFFGGGGEGGRLEKRGLFSIRESRFIVFYFCCLHSLSSSLPPPGSPVLVLVANGHVRFGPRAAAATRDETTTTVTGIGFPLSAICYRIAASYSTHNLKIPGTLLGEWTASEHERGCRMYCPNDCLTVDMT